MTDIHLHVAKVCSLKVALRRLSFLAVSFQIMDFSGDMTVAMKNIGDLVQLSSPVFFPLTG